MSIERMERWLLAISTLLLFEARAHATAPDVAARIDVRDAFVFETAPFQVNAAGFLRLRNRDHAPHRLMSVASGIADQTELHQTTRDGGTARMRRIDSLEIPSDGELALHPDGPHLMLLGIAHPLRRGEHVSLTLRFEDGSQSSIEAEVRGLR